MNRRTFLSSLSALLAATTLRRAAAATNPLTTSAPQHPTPTLAGLIGEYGALSDSEERLLLVYEQGGLLYAGGRGLPDARLEPQSATRFLLTAPQRVLLEFTDKDGRVDAVRLGNQDLIRRDIGAEVQTQIQSGVKMDAQRLRDAAQALAPPAEQAPKRTHDLVPVRTYARDVRLDIRYAGAENFMGVPIYECAAAFLQRPAARALARAQEKLRHRGYGLLVYDAYRPWYATKMFWEATPEHARKFVADPSQGSRHNRGCAVDLTLYELASGQPVEMCSRYDEMSQRSHPDFRGGTTRQRWHRDLLREAMERERFTVNDDEWWHFDYENWRDYGIGRASFTELQRQQGRHDSACPYELQGRTTPPQFT